jgi:hypothetical protein
MSVSARYAEPGCAADRLQRPLLRRSRFQRRLTPSVGRLARCIAESQGYNILTKPIPRLPAADMEVYCAPCHRVTRSRGM